MSEDQSVADPGSAQRPPEGGSVGVGDQAEATIVPAITTTDHIESGNVVVQPTEKEDLKAIKDHATRLHALVHEVQSLDDAATNEIGVIIGDLEAIWNRL